jgi:hypothetical protein
MQFANNSMWIKKSPQELGSDLRLRILACGLGALAVLLLSYVTVVPHSIYDLSVKARIASALAACLSLAVLIRGLRARRVRSQVSICSQCNLVTINQEQHQCPCGGSLASLRDMKWVETTSSRTEPPANTVPNKMAFAIEAA